MGKELLERIAPQKEDAHMLPEMCPPKLRLWKMPKLAHRRHRHRASEGIFLSAHETFKGGKISSVGGISPNRNILDTAHRPKRHLPSRAHG